MATASDEIVYGSMVVDDNGKGLFSTGLRHGDALHVGDSIPARPGLEVFGIHENEERTVALGTPGMALYDARTGQIIWSLLPGGDVGRGLAADIDPRHRRLRVLDDGAGRACSTAQGSASADAPTSVNFAVWWDADPLREILDSNWISKWDWNTAHARPAADRGRRRVEQRHQATPRSPADILGDWREEVIWRAADNVSLRIYTTTIPAAQRHVHADARPAVPHWRSRGRTSATTSRRIRRSSSATAWRTAAAERRASRYAGAGVRHADTVGAASCGRPNGRFVPVSIDAPLVDLLDGAPTARIVNVTSNDPDPNPRREPGAHRSGPLGGAAARRTATRTARSASTR